MGKFIFLALAVIAALLWLRYKARAAGRVDRPDARAKARVESMVRCANCGVHLPVNEALQDAAGDAYCSSAHRIAGKSAP